MENTIRQILKNHNINDSKVIDKMVSKLLTQKEIQDNLKLIIDAQKKIMHEAMIYKEREEFADAFFRSPMQIPGRNMNLFFRWNSFRISELKMFQD
ncbi:hypothetical protein ACFP3I_25385 [Chryseobacterium arachidis]|uniref:hypothetical protein n=1 Tax=Chryseobacterium arachidis TaxID=1416778 RepID=UPI003618EC45